MVMVRASPSTAPIDTWGSDEMGMTLRDYVASSPDIAIHKDARVSGDARVYGSARVQTVNVTATRTDSYTFLVAPTPDGPRVIAGCRYFTFKEAEAHWKRTRGGTKLGDESLSIIKHLETMAKLNGFMEPVADATR